jgi:hypothetical protein
LSALAGAIVSKLRKENITLMNPPSGFARRYFGCVFTVGASSVIVVTMRNFEGGGLEYTISPIIDPGSRNDAPRGEKLVGEILGLVAIIGPGKCVACRGEYCAFVS